jgi:hypothetical protein
MKWQTELSLINQARAAFDELIGGARHLKFSMQENAISGYGLFGYPVRIAQGEYLWGWCIAVSSRHVQFVPFDREHTKQETVWYFNRHNERWEWSIKFDDSGYFVVGKTPLEIVTPRNWVYDEFGNGTAVEK